MFYSWHSLYTEKVHAILCLTSPHSRQNKCHHYPLFLSNRFLPEVPAASVIIRVLQLLPQDENHPYCFLFYLLFPQFCFMDHPIHMGIYFSSLLSELLPPNIYHNPQLFAPVFPHQFISIHLLSILRKTKTYRIKPSFSFLGQGRAIIRPIYFLLIHPATHTVLTCYLH